ncbi:DUF397 domain-containing protein [Spirillospora sp. NPDC049024]
MFSGLHDIGWSSMEHAYGSAEEVPTLLALRSSDAEKRQKALGRFYGAVHHQGDVYPCTTASLPFLFEPADAVAVRDSKDPDGPVLRVTRAALWTAVQAAADTH